ncbi:T9SS type A sorting domain-containing protein [Fibrella sp. HMF5335]|uniref:T9SS type A sorting domain-containing protein n=1 Tax=Fibrella rubiginis TaxID=2817060 RepID=A0A939K7H6_9BACT|nr:T9SS type A sorting domain-containing protein [Fibrella rubiginis]MBO0938635.1 T9SS type A sorting domain-containing protein [Fibrella rubiginis]
MKQNLLAYGLFIGLLWTTSTRAQEPGRSRLELGRKNGPTSVAATNTRPQRLLMPRPMPMSPMDRLLTQGRNDMLRDYYRSILLAPSVIKTGSVRSSAATPESTATSLPVVDRQPEDAVHSEEQMYNSSRLTVSNIYPNPAHELAEIDYTMHGSVGGVNITLLNILGAPVAEYSLDRNERKVRIQTRDLPTGYYFYQLSVEGVKVATKKLLVKHQ